LEAKLALAARDGRPLRVKLGIDPTAPDIHLGFTVVLGKLREFQELGHQVVLIIGDWTARVGDPSGRSATRPVLTPEEIDANAETFAAQAMTVLREDRLEVRKNSEWLDMPLAEMFGILRSTTVAQVTEREDIANRLASGSPVSLLELLYPVMQGYDSVAVKADVELGGSDQHFNLLLGRDLQRAFGQPEQVALELPILTGTDGERKMSKSLGNYIGVTEEPTEIYGKTMSLPDEALAEWYGLLLDSEPPPDLGPRDSKRALACALVERFHDSESASAAQEHFDSVIVRGEIPDDVGLSEVGATDGAVHLPAALAEIFGVSRSEARRALSQGGVKLDGVVVEVLDVPSAEIDGKVLQMGKRRHRRVSVSGS
jgi:tyrosyl-tRNA synthetase